jgi:hypothetical protein
MDEITEGRGLSKKFWIVDFRKVSQINDAVGEFIGGNTPHYPC